MIRTGFVICKNDDNELIFMNEARQTQDALNLYHKGLGFTKLPLKQKNLV